MLNPLLSSLSSPDAFVAGVLAGALFVALTLLLWALVLVPLAQRYRITITDTKRHRTYGERPWYQPSGRR